jgi:hypothetical protein
MWPFNMPAWRGFVAADQDDLAAQPAMLSYA